MIAGMDLKASSLMSFVPWVVMALGSTTAGLLADGLVRFFSLLAAQPLPPGGHCGGKQCLLSKLRLATSQRVFNNRPHRTPRFPRRCGAACPC